MSSQIRLALLLPLAGLAACNPDVGLLAGGNGGVRTWATGQAAEAVFGASSVGSPGSGATTQGTFKGVGALALSPTGSLFVQDNGAFRVLRFDSAAARGNGALADGVLGQGDFVSSIRNAGLAGDVPVRNGFSDGLGIAVDAFGNLYLADSRNTRVLRFDDAQGKRNGASADGVLGQLDFISNGFSTNASRFIAVAGVVTDAGGRVWVADGANNRVLRFDNAAALANGSAASGVLGQADFTTRTSGTSDRKMSSPTSVTVDAQGTLYVGERGNHRVLVFLDAASKANGAGADRVLGQKTFIAGADNAIVGTQANIYLPYAMTTDARGNLYVADGGFNRVLIFYDAAHKGNGAYADAVLGKASFTDIATTTASASTFGQPYGIAVQSSTGKLWVSDHVNGRVLRFQALAPLQ